MILYRVVKLAILFLSIIQSLSGQIDQNNFVLDSIQFDGLTKTKSSYLKSLLQVKSKTQVSLDKINSDLQLLKNLPSIADARFEIDRFEQNTHLKYILEERRTALPIINFGGIRDNIWFSLGVIENNLKGRGDLLLAYYQNNNGLHAGQLYFKRPRILNSNWGYSLSLNKWSSEEPVFFEEGTVQYYYDNNGITATLIRHFGMRNYIEVGGTYFEESYDKSDIQFLDNPPGPENFAIDKFLTKLILKQDWVDYNYFYLKGWEAYLNYQNVLNFDDKSVFNSLQLQAKLFTRPHPRINFAYRLRAAISTNENTPFAPFVADSHVNIRGIGNRIDRGTAQLVFNAELRYTTHHKKLWSVQLVAFADSGTWRNPGGALSDIFDSNQFRQFIGAGFRINYQKVFGATIRVDYGIDIYNPDQRGIVIGLGQYY